MEQIQDRLKQLRKALDLKQRDVAERLEMNVGTVGAWECGSEKIPKTRIYQICKEYNVNRDWLERGEGEMFVKEELNAETLRRQIVALYNSLDAKNKAIFLAVAQGIVEAKDTKTACKNVDAAINGINNQGATPKPIVNAVINGDNNEQNIRVKNG